MKNRSKKKLSLKSETVRRLADDRLAEAAGGTGRTNPTLWTDCCPTICCRTPACPC
jgi:hypothetical protein